MKLKEQVKVYLITYAAQAFIHFQREFWSLSKSYLKVGPYKSVYTASTLSHIDFAELVSFSIFLYVCGIVGDGYD